LQILVELIAKGGTVKAVIEEKDLVQVTELAFITIVVRASNEVFFLIYTHYHLGLPQLAWD
jgi:hypothetical protein